MAAIPINAKADAAFEKGLPGAPDVERLILGAILLDSGRWPIVERILNADDFALNKHRTIFKAIARLIETAGSCDRVTLSIELQRIRQLESVDGMGYIVSLDDGLPTLVNLEQYCRIVLEKSRLRALIYMGETLRNQALEEIVKPDEITQSHQDKVRDLNERLMSDRGEDAALSPEQIFTSVGFNSFLDPSKRQGIRTGYVELDEMTCGLAPGDLFVLAARPAMGKTALAMNIAVNVAARQVDPQPVLVFSLEMSAESLMQRVVTARARVSAADFRHGRMDHEQTEKCKEVMGEAAAWPLWIDDQSRTLDEIGAVARRRKPGLIIVDYLQLMSEEGENRTQEVSRLTRGLKLLAMELKCPIIALSQLSRKVEERGDKRPQLADLRDSGSIEQDADLVAFVFREEYYSPTREDLHGIAELILAKQRKGPVGMIKLIWIAEYTKFENAGYSWQEAPPE